MPIILACVLLVPAAAVAFSLAQKKRYTAEATLLFRDPGFDQSVLGSPFFAPNLDPAREAETNLKLVSLGGVADLTARQIGGGLTGGAVQRRMNITQQGQSNLVSVDATDPNPRLAARIATAFALQFIAFRRQADRAKLAEALVLTRRELTSLGPQPGTTVRRRTLVQRANQLETLVNLQTGNAELVQSARTPTSPSSPKPVRNAIIGVGLGLVLGLALAMLLEQLDRRVRDLDEMADVFDRPILSAIPESRSLGRSGQDHLRRDGHVAEAFRMLRANLRYFNVDRNVESLLVTSAAPGDGKSTVASNLAIAAAAAGASVLLLEADLRHPSLARGLGLGIGPGLTDVLARGAEIDDVVQQVIVPQVGDSGSPRTLDVIVAGPLPPNPTELIESARMQEILREAERRHDLVVVDTPPTTVVSDAIPLVTQVGGVLVVCRLGKSTRDSVRHLRNELVHLDARILGVVVNAVTRQSGGYYAEAYHYGYETQPAVAETSTPLAVRSSTDAGGVAQEDNGTSQRTTQSAGSSAATSESNLPFKPLDRTR